MKLTPDEKRILDLLAEAWHCFVELEPQTGQTLRDFSNGLHRCQDQIALRVAARVNPEVWQLGERGRRE